jgi:hypothetical protein
MLSVHAAERREVAKANSMIAKSNPDVKAPGMDRRE